jgi:hypothetical protein
VRDGEDNIFYNRRTKSGVSRVGRRFPAKDGLAATVVLASMMKSMMMEDTRESASAHRYVQYVE